MRTYLSTVWNRLSLAWRFNLLSLMILLVSLLLLGWWVGRAISVGVVHRTAAGTSLYVENFIVTQLQELTDSTWLSKEHVAELERLLASSPLGREIVAIKIWGPNGRIVYGAGADHTYPVKDEQARAWRGEVVSHISRLSDEENVAQRQEFDRLLETYTPIRLEGSDRVIAVAEFYASVDALEREIRTAQIQSWLVVSGVIFSSYLLLSGLVRQGSRTIARQQTELRERLGELDGLLKQNQTLSERVGRAARRTAALNERFLRRISAELHDGPAQDLSFALLRLDSLSAHIPDEVESAAPVSAIYTSLQRATQEIRHISRGLRLPELEPLSLDEVVSRAVREYESRSCSKVQVSSVGLPSDAPVHVKITVYRIIQESLNNAFKHGGSCHQRVTLRSEHGAVLLVVEDDGRGFLFAASGDESGLGIAGMRERVESVGGVFEIRTAPGRGTRVRAVIPLGAA